MLWELHCLKIATRGDPIDLVFGSLEVEELHIFAHVDLGVQPQEGDEHTKDLTENSITIPDLRCVIIVHTMAETQPGGLPLGASGVGALFGCAVGHGESGTSNAERLGKLVKHLLIIVETELSHNQFVHVGFHVWIVIAQFLQKGIVLGRHVVGVLDGCGQFWRNGHGHTPLIACHGCVIAIENRIPIVMLVGGVDEGQGVTLHKTDMARGRGRDSSSTEWTCGPECVAQELRHSSKLSGLLLFSTALVVVGIIYFLVFPTIQ